MRRRWYGGNIWEREASQGGGVPTVTGLLEEQELSPQDVAVGNFALSAPEHQMQPTSQDVHFQIAQRPLCFDPVLRWIWIIHVYCSQDSRDHQPHFSLFCLLEYLVLSWGFIILCALLIEWRWDLWGTSIQGKVICLTFLSASLEPLVDLTFLLCSNRQGHWALQRPLITAFLAGILSVNNFRTVAEACLGMPNQKVVVQDKYYFYLLSSLKDQLGFGHGVIVLLWGLVISVFTLQ